MEEALKARLIGAAALVVIAVLLIPELLSGRKAVEPVVEPGAGQSGTRSFTIELGGAPSQSARSPVTSPTPTPTPAAGASTPAAVVPQAEAIKQPPEQPATANTTPTASERTVETPPAIATPAPRPETAAPAAGGDWAVQVGAFGSADTARKLVKDLAGAGYRAYVSPVQKGGRTLHRVRVGPEADKAGAEQLAQRLRGRGLPATVVRND